MKVFFHLIKSDQWTYFQNIVWCSKYLQTYNKTVGTDTRSDPVHKNFGTRKKGSPQCVYFYTVRVYSLELPPVSHRHFIHLLMIIHRWSRMDTGQYRKLLKYRSTKCLIESFLKKCTPKISEISTKGGYIRVQSDILLKLNVRIFLA